jgi:PAS domain S-box-containing protein
LAALGVWNVPLFHAVAELLGLCMVAAIFALSWETHDVAREDPLVMVTRGYFWVGLLDAVHFLTYPGMILHGVGGTDITLSIRLWYGARLVEALLLLALAVPWPTAWGWRPLFGLLGLVTLVLVYPALVPGGPLERVFPAQGDAVSTLGEVGPILMLLVGLALLARPGRAVPRRERGLLLATLALTAAGQAVYLVASPEGDSIVLGHLCKILSYWTFYVCAGRVHVMGPLGTFAQRQAEWRAMEERLTDEKERAERFLEIAQALIIGLDKDGRVVVANPHACATLGWTEQDLLGQDWFEVALPLAERAAVRAAFRRIVSSDLLAVEFHENDVLTRDGAVIRVTWHNTVTRDRRGRVTGTLSSGQDVTQRKRVEDALTEAKEAAEDANRAKSDFLASISHELRTPLNAVIGFSEAMEAEIMGPLDNPTYRDYAANIRVSGAHLLDLINDILDVSAIEAGKLDLRSDRVDLSRAVTVALEMVRGRAEGRGVTLESALTDGAPALLADERRLRQMLVNLLGNAVKFTPRGGTVTVRLEGRAPDGALGLSVVDTGPGMSPGELAIAMRPFGRVIDPNAPWREGTGLGLPLVEGLIAAHGGRLDMDTAPGRGTRATLWFPGDRVERSVDRLSDRSGPDWSNHHARKNP